VSALTNSLADISEMADDLLEQVNGKAVESGEGGDGSVVKIRAAIKTLKAEMVAMSTTTGLLGTQLLKCQQEKISRQLNREARKRKSRIMLKGVKALSTSFGGGELDSDSN
jgi:hypothetical protein